MGLTPSNKAQEKWESSDGAADFLQLTKPDGSVPGWIDGTATPQGALAPVKVNRALVTSAQLIAMSNGGTPAIVVPAPGAGLFINPIGISLRYLFGTKAYSISGTSGLEIGWGSTFNSLDLNNIQAAISETGLLTPSYSAFFGVSISGVNGNPVPLANIVNQPVVLGTNDTITSGDGTLLVTTVYTIESAS